MYLSVYIEGLEGIKGQCEDVLASWSRISEFWSSNVSNPDLRLSDLGYLTLLRLLELEKLLTLDPCFVEPLSKWFAQEQP